MLDSLDLETEREIIRNSLSGKEIIELLPEEYKEKHLRKSAEFSPETEEELEEEGDKIRILLTSYLKAKGLSANYVFLVGLENGIMPENIGKISEDELCQFIVMVTRARKSLEIVASRSYSRARQKSVDRLSILVQMLPTETLDIVENIRSADLPK